MKKLTSLIVSASMLLSMLSVAVYAADDWQDGYKRNTHGAEIQSIESIQYDYVSAEDATLTIAGKVDATTYNEGCQVASNLYKYVDGQNDSQIDSPTCDIEAGEGDFELKVENSPSLGDGHYYIYIANSEGNSTGTANAQVFTLYFTVENNTVKAGWNTLIADPSGAPTGNGTIAVAATNGTVSGSAVASQATGVTLTVSGYNAANGGTLSYKWYKGDTEITNDTTSYTVNDGVLTIATYSSAFAGTYKCEAYNTETDKAPTKAENDATVTLTTTKIDQSTPVTVAVSGEPTTDSITVKVEGGNGTGNYKVAYVDKNDSAPTKESTTWADATKAQGATEYTATISGLDSDTEYDFYAYRLGDADYNDSNVSGSAVTIKTSDGIAIGTFGTLTKAYDGKAFVPAFTPASGVTAADYTIQYSTDGGNNWSETAPVNAGEYKVKATTSKAGYKDTSAQTLTISKAAADIKFEASSLVEGNIGEVKATVVLDPDATLVVNYVVPEEGESGTTETLKSYDEAKEYLNGLKSGDTFKVKVESYDGNDNVEALDENGATATYTVGSKSGGIIIASGNKKPTEKPEEKPESTKETYVAGNPDGSFAPDRSITRGELATFLARLSKGYDADTIYATAAADVGNSYYTNPVNYMASVGVLNGYTDGSIRPNGNCTRAEFATMLCRALGLSPTSVTKFSDVSNNDWYGGYIGALADAGVISGYNDGTCRPDNQITRAEAVSMINRALNIAAYSDGDFTEVPTDMSSGHWAYNDVLLAMNTDISEHKV